MSNLSQQHPLDLLLKIAVIGIGTLILLFGLYLVGQNIYIISTHTHAKAEVIESSRIGRVAARGLTDYSIRVRFDSGGRVQTAYLDRANTNHGVGDVISVYFYPETAYKVTDGSFGQMWFHSLFLFVIAGIFIFYGARPAKAKT